MAVSPKLLSLAFTVCCAFTLLLSVAGTVTSELAFRDASNRISQRFGRHCGSTRSIVVDGEFTGWNYCHFPATLHLGNEEAVLGASITTLLVTTFLLLTIWGGKREFGFMKRPTHRLMNMRVVSSAICFVVSFIALVYNQAANRNSSTVKTTGFGIPPPERGPYDFERQAIGYEGSYNLQSWSCQMSRVLQRLGDPDLRLARTCDLTTAARWIMVPLAVFTAAMLVVAVLDSPATGETHGNPVVVETGDHKESLEMPERESD